MAVVKFLGVLLFCTIIIVSGKDVDEAIDKDVKYFFGSSQSELSGSELAASYPDGSCFSVHFQCYGDVNNMISEFDAITPYDCCKSCLADSSCKSWNHFYQNATVVYTFASLLAKCF